MGQSLGTFSFMPPEQIGKAKTVDHRADIYACATMIYQSMSGQLPYQARNLLIMVEMKQKTDARRLAEAMAGPVDPRLEAFLAKGLAREPADRFQSALEGLTAWRELRPAKGASRSTVSPSSSKAPSSNASGHALATPPPPHQSYKPPSSGAIKLPVPPADAILIRTATDPGAQPPVEAVARQPSEPALAALHRLGEPALPHSEVQRPSHAAAGQPVVPSMQWTGPNGTMVLNNAARELVPPIVSPPVSPRTFPDLATDSSAGPTSQGPTLVYKPMRPTIGSVASGLPAPGEPVPTIEQRPAATPPARTFRTIVYVVAALLFAVVGFLLMGMALEYLNMPK
jgi:serine/threonine-protein kinase